MQSSLQEASLLTSRSRQLAVVAWWIGLASIALLPSLTWAESISFNLAGFAVHGRFLLYAAFAAAFVIAAALLLLYGYRPRRLWAATALGFVIWLIIATIVNGQSPREWLPTMLRWLLYLSAGVIGFAAFVARDDSRRSRQFATALLGSAVVPLVVGAVELIRGSAPMLNNAPRISGTMVGHPVAFSLFLGIVVVFFVPHVYSVFRERRVFAVATAVLLAAAYLEILFTYTRWAIILVPIVAALSVGLSGPRQHRVIRLGLSLGLAAGIVIHVAPFVEARFGNEPPMSIEIPSGDGVQPSQTTDGGENPLAIDNSAVFRIQTHEYGFRFITERPVFGSGPGSFDRLYAAETGRQRVAAHDDILLVAVELGVVGVVLFFSLYVATIRELLGGLNLTGHPRAFSIGVGASFVMINVASVIHNPTYFPELQIPLWIGAGAVMGRMHRVRRSEPGLREPLGR
jgi:O-antigen ligase